MSNNTGNVQGEDLVSSVLAMQNQERAAVGVPPLTWSDTIAASAQTWADHVLATSDSTHSTGTGYGENIAWEEVHHTQLWPTAAGLDQRKE